jgi:hypothetical protein
MRSGIAYDILGASSAATPAQSKAVSRIYREAKFALSRLQSQN